MPFLLPTPRFDNNTTFFALNPSQKAIEAQYIIDTINPNKIPAITSNGYNGIELAKLCPNTHVYLPIDIPTPILEKTREASTNVMRVGRNYIDCRNISEGIIRNRSDLLNVSDGMMEKHQAFNRILHNPIQEYDPTHIFVPCSNANLTVGILEYLEENNLSHIKVIACVLPDHFKLSSRFNTHYRHAPFLTGHVFDGFYAPGLNQKYKQYENFLAKTVISAEYTYEKYNPHYSALDPMNYLTMEISTKFRPESRKLIILSGENRL